MRPAAIIDCDPDHDDVMAILVAGRTLDRRALTTVHGNSSLATRPRLRPDLRPIPTPRLRAEGAAPIADVAVVVDTPRFRELFLDVLATYP